MAPPHWGHRLGKKVPRRCPRTASPTTPRVVTSAALAATQLSGDAPGGVVASHQAPGSTARTTRTGKANERFTYENPSVAGKGVEDRAWALRHRAGRLTMMRLSRWSKGS